MADPLEYEEFRLTVTKNGDLVDTFHYECTLEAAEQAAQVLQDTGHGVTVERRSNEWVLVGGEHD